MHSAHYFCMKKGKTLFMLSALKEFGAIMRKRKKSIKEFDSFKEEEKKDLYQKERNYIKNCNKK